MRSGFMAVLVLLSASAAFGQAVYTLEHAGRMQRIAPVSTEFDGIPYVSANAFVSALNGSIVLAEGQIQIDALGEAALVAPGTRQVQGSRTGFGLFHPVIWEGDAAWVSVADIVALFDRGFGVTWIRSAAEEPPSNEDAPPVMEDAPAAMVVDGERVDAAPTPVGGERFVVLIDPGRGGSDPGVIGGRGLTEAEAALQVALAVREAMAEDTSIEIRLSRDSDRELSALERTRLAMDISAGLTVSLHAGAALTSTTSGFAVIYAPGMSATDERSRKGRAAALAIAEGLESEMGAAALAVRSMPLRMAGAMEIPGILVQLGTMNNPTEERLLGDADYQKQLARGIADGIRRFRAADRSAAQ